jgi:hypothetical protein
MPARAWIHQRRIRRRRIDQTAQFREKLFIYLWMSQLSTQSNGSMSGLPSIYPWFQVVVVLIINILTLKALG